MGLDGHYDIDIIERDATDFQRRVRQVGKAISVFSYDGLDKDTKGMLINLAGQINREKKKHATSGMEIGKSVAEAHEVLSKAGKEGAFSQWVESQCGFSRTTAYNYMWAWQRFGNCSTVEQFDDGAMYALASPKAPPAAAKEAEKRADKGEKITIERARELLDKFRDVAKKPRKNKAAPSEPDSGEKSSASPTATTTSTSAPSESEALEAEPVKELTFEEQVKQENGKIESFCRGLTKWFEENCPKVASIDHMGRFDSALGQIRAACGTLRTCKYHDEPCPKCSGNGCSKCEKESDFGAVTVLTYRQLAG